MGRAKGNERRGKARQGKARHVRVRCLIVDEQRLYQDSSSNPRS